MSDPLRLEDSVLYRFAVVTSRVGARVHAFCRSRFGLSVPAWRTLAHLAQLQPVSAKEIGQRAAMDSVSVTRALNQLDELGFLDRGVDSDDRRRSVLRLTGKGQAAYNAIAPLSVAAERELLADFSAAERAALHELTRRLWDKSEALQFAYSGKRATR